jgi:hypothetical protein
VLGRVARQKRTQRVGAPLGRAVPLSHARPRYRRRSRAGR